MTRLEIALENARLYADLAEREASIRRLVDANIVGVVVWGPEGQLIEVLIGSAAFEQGQLVEGDRVQVQQVMLNLIVNAIVSTSKDESGSALIAVRDSGPGVAPQDVERLFETFYTTKAAGMGMGLSICRSIVEEHGGRIWVSGNVPHGPPFSSPCQSNRATREASKNRISTHGVCPRRDFASASRTQ